MKHMTRIVLLCSVVLLMVARGAAAADGLPQPSFALSDPGTERVVDYAKYGEFKDVGTEKYKYSVTDKKGLSAAVGQGIYPNTTSMEKDPEHQRLVKEQKLTGNQWEYVNTPDYQANFYRWATASEAPGVRLFYTGIALENAGQMAHAIKAYYAIVVSFPQSVGYTYWNTPWYVGPAALDRILFLTNKYPALGIKLVDARISIENRYDNDTRNDLFFTTPGRLTECPAEQVRTPVVDVSTLKVKQRQTFRNVELVQYENGHWQMLHSGKPYMIKAIGYQPSKIGQSPDIGTLEDWTLSDHNKNGKIDAPYDAWVDKNRNNVQDPDEPVVGDFQLLKDLGVNTIRVYHHGFAKNKELFKDLFATYGIQIAIGDFLGMYAVGSKAAWDPGTNYSNEEQQRNMLESVMQMVNEYKDEPCVLMWVLGNENNYGTANNADEDPLAYYRFVNQVAKKIKEVDPHHPVMLCNGDIQYLNHFAAACPDVDIFGANAYRGKNGFGYFNFWLPVKELADKPAFITEYGCPAYGRGFSREYAENFQSEFLVNNWMDMVHNSAGQGAGNAIGGALFEFVDEWWKTGAPPGFPDIIQDVTPNCGGPFVDGWYYEEWFGITSQGDGTDSPFLRQLRQSYVDLQRIWKEGK